MKFIALLPVLLVTATCASQSVQPVISGNSVGDLVIGSVPPKIDAHRLLSREWQKDEDGESYELVRVKVQGVVVDAEVYEGKVWRLSIDDPGLLTEDGVGVGSNAGNLLDKNKTIKPQIGPGPMLVLVPAKPCGLSYWTDAQLPDTGSLTFSRESAAPLLKNARVTRILFVGCSLNRPGI